MPSRAASERREGTRPVNVVVFAIPVFLVLAVGGFLFFGAADIARYLRMRRM